jgi:hypothetical protein
MRDEGQGGNKRGCTSEKYCKNGRPKKFRPIKPTESPIQQDRSGTLYFNMQITTNADIQENTLAYKAENSYGGYGTGPQLGPIMTSPAYGIDFASNMMSLRSDFSADAGFYPISVEVNWSQSKYGTRIHDIGVGNSSPTIAYVDEVIFSNTFHKPNVLHPGDMKYTGTYENHAGYNGTLNMNVGAVAPNHQVMTIKIATSGGFPEAPYLSFSLRNLPSGCALPLWQR